MEIVERRQSKRIPLQMMVSLRCESKPDFMREHAVNISSGGMFIRTDSPHQEGSSVYLEFELNNGERLISGLGRVIHVNPPEHPVAGMGVEFVSLDKASQDLVDEIVGERIQELLDDPEIMEAPVFP